MVKKAENIIVGISIGDLNGIGPEVVLKSFEDKEWRKVTYADISVGDIVKVEKHQNPFQILN